MNRAWINRLGVVVFVSALTACGGSGKNASTSTATSASTSTSTSPSTTTTSTVPDAAADEALARSLLLVQSDLPAGWSGSPHVNDPSDAVLDKQLAACVGASDPANAIVDINGLDFANGDAEVGTSVVVTANRADFDTDVAALRSAKYETCLQRLLSTVVERQLQKDAPGAVISDVTIARFASPVYGEVTVASRLTMTITFNGRAIKFYGENFAYGQGRSEVNLTFSNIGAPFDPSLERSLLAKAGAKLKAAV